MKLPILASIFLAGSLALAGSIVQKPLDEFIIYDIPVASKTGTTTVMFPSEISGLFAKSVAVQDQENAGFLISFTPGNFYFTIRALKQDAEDHLTVIFNRKAYILHLTASENPFYNVTFYLEERNGKDGRIGVLPERILSLMDKAKAYPLLLKAEPDGLAGVAHSSPAITNYYKDFSVRILDVWRFEEEDTLIFRLELVNETDQPIYYKPQDLAVRLDERIYTQSLADASGVMPPKSVTPAFFAITGNGQGGRNHLAPDNKWNVLVVRDESRPASKAAGRKFQQKGLAMNLRDFKTELLNKPTGRLILFLFAGGVILAFVLMRRDTGKTAKVTPAVPAQATTAKGYTIDEGIPDIKPMRPTPSPTPLPMMPEVKPVAVKTPPPIPQAIFAMKESSLSENYLPYGRLLKCELVNTVDSINLETPIIGLVTEDVWRDGRLIIPAGTEVHGAAKNIAARDRVGSEHEWMIVFQNGKQLPLAGTVLDYAPDEKEPDRWQETDGSAGLRGYKIAADRYAEAKAILASMVSAGAGGFPEATNIISPLTGAATQIQGGGMTQALSAGIQAGGQLYAQRLLEGMKNNPYYVRVPAGTLFYLYVTQTVDLNKAARGLTSNPSNK